MKKIFDGQTADGDSLDFKHITPNRSNLLMVYIDGNLGGGTLTFYAHSPDDSVDMPLAGGSLDSEGAHVIEAPAFKGFAKLSDSSGADVSVWVESESDAYGRIVG
jgi:hypothetical protein